MSARKNRTEMPITDIIVGKRHRRSVGDVSSLAASIRDVGLLHPPVIKPDGELIAGERRLRACESLGWKRVPVRVVDIDNVTRGELAENVEREPFLPSEIEAIRRELEPVEKAAAKERMREGGKGRKVSGPSDVRDNIGAFAGISGRTVEKIAAVVAAAEARPEKFGKLVEEMDRSGRVNGPYRRLKNAQQAEAIRAEPPPLPNKGPYRGAMLDFPWAYDSNDDEAAERGVLPYPTMGIEQACAFARDKIAPILHEDCALGFWTTNYILVRGLHLPVLNALGGFEPKTLLTWPKDRHTFKAHWLRGQTEHLVIATRGKPVVTLSNQTTLLQGPFTLVDKGQHSAKPAEAYTLFESLFPAARYVDLFSRYQHNERWDCYGDQAPRAEAAE